MKLTITEWALVVNSLVAQKLNQREKQEQSIQKGDTTAAKLAYIASENARMLAEKIESETLG